MCPGFTAAVLLFPPSPSLPSDQLSPCPCSAPALPFLEKLSSSWRDLCFSKFLSDAFLDTGSHGAPHPPCFPSHCGHVKARAVCFLCPQGA